MTEVDAAWLSGWLEGEGYFSCARNTPTIQVTSTDYDVIERAACLMGAKDKPRLVKKPREDVKQAYRLCLYGINAVRIMQHVRPYMGRRRGSAIDAALEYYTNTGKRYGRRKGPTPKSSDDMKKRWANPAYREHRRNAQKNWDSSAMGKMGGHKSWETRKTKIQRSPSGRFVSLVDDDVL